MMVEIQIDNNIPLATDDCLNIIKYLTSDIFESKLWKVLLWVILLMHGVTTLITTYFFIFVLNRKEFVNYSAIYFASFYAMLAVSMVLFKGQLLNNFMARLDRWTMDSVDKVTRSSIERETLLLKTFTILLFSLSLVCGSLSMPMLPNDRSLYFALKFIDTYLPNYNIILGYLYKSTILFVQCIGSVHPCLCLYCTQHAKFQLILFKQYITNIPNATDDLNDLTYQEEVRKRLFITIKRSIHFIELLSSSLNEMKNLIVSFSLCGCILGISLAVSFVSGLLTPDYYPNIMMMCFTGTAAFCGTIWAGQSMETEIEEMWKTMVTVNWYNFNQNNKKLYLIFLMNMMKERKIEFSETYSINYELGLAIIRGIYSVASVVFSGIY